MDQHKCLFKPFTRTVLYLIEPYERFSTLLMKCDNCDVIGAWIDGKPELAVQS